MYLKFSTTFRLKTSVIIKSIKYKILQEQDNEHEYRTKAKEIVNYWQSHWYTIKIIIVTEGGRL